MEKQILIAEGAFGWFGGERRSDRYGAITVFDSDSNDKKIVDKYDIKMDVIKELVGKKGKLTCTVIETRESTHIGDLFRGISPVTPALAENIELGEGEFFTENGYEGHPVFGLKPSDGRQSDWLNPKNLYRAHEQTVKIFFIPS